jgi:hypothetical protein
LGRVPEMVEDCVVRRTGCGVSLRFRNAIPLGNQLRDEAQDSLWLVRGTSSAQTVVV